MEKRFQFSISSSVKNAAQMQPCTPELLNAALDSQQVADTCNEIAAKLQQVKKGTLTREAFETLKSKLKADNLPVVCFHATFTDGHRSNQSAVPSGLSIYDIDHLQEDPRAYYYNKVAGREAELGISFAHVSPSNEGIRLVFDIPQGMNLAQAQQWMSEQLGDDTYDGCVKDWARCSFVVCRDYVLYYDEEELFREREVSVTMETKDSAVSVPLLPATTGEEHFEDNFNGIQYPQIVRALEEVLGGVPAQGARNNFIFAMTCHLRYVCNNDPRWISQVLPRYGEEEQKFQSTVRSACIRPQTQSVPEVVTRALENARNAREKEESILLAENERLRANLLRAVSHDLRTPLTSIMGNADNLITSGETLDPATRAQVYHDIYNDAQWLTGMVENLLSASRMNEGKLNLNITTELMDDLIGEAVRHLGKRLDAFVFEWRKPDQLLFVRADARLIVQVILNLLDNAMKYTQPGSRIWIRTGKENGEVRVCVEDDGPGIPDDQKPHIFDLFYTSGNPAGDSRRGLGVGLALCQSILKAHDGRIWVTDRIPRGVCFEFALPEEEVTVHE